MSVGVINLCKLMYGRSAKVFCGRGQENIAGLDISMNDSSVIMQPC